MNREPLCYYEDETSMRFYLINCGSGLMHLIIFPDDTVMLYDCNVTDDNYSRIIKELDEYICEKYYSDENAYIKAIDIFVNSHRDTDHLRGLKKINDIFPIRSIWDSGQSGANTDNPDYKYYMQLRRNLKAINESNLVVLVPSSRSIHNFSGVEIYCLADAKEYVELNMAMESAEPKVQHTNALVLLLKYGEIKMLLTGDSDWKSWRDKIVPNFKDKTCSFMNTNILIASHHGSRSFFTDEDEIDEEKNPENTYIESIKLINPDITLISCGDYDEYHHPNESAMKLYKEYTSYAQVYTTREWMSTFAGVINLSGEYSVSLRSFKNTYERHNYGFNLVCVECGSKKKINSGDSVKIGSKLHFSIEAYGDILKPTERPSVNWRVSNNGINEYSEHHEIYCKGKDEKTKYNAFERDVTYEGLHLLCCQIRNRKKGFFQSKIFVVKGIENEY